MFPKRDSKTEFTVENPYPYDQRNPVRWLISHAFRRKWLALLSATCFIVSFLAYSQPPLLYGQAMQEILQPTAGNALLRIALTVLFFLAASGIVSLIGSLTQETIAQHMETDSREELYASLLGKSQAFHDRQRVGDIMARATDDVRQLNGLINPGVSFIIETVLSFVIPIIYIGTVRTELLLFPLLFLACYIFLVTTYTQRITPVLRRQREQFGKMNAGLEESISGIEVVKASAQEVFERRKFRQNARLYRDYFVRQGHLEARYLPLLFYGFAVGLTFLHCMGLYQQGVLSIPQIVTVMSFMALLRFPTFISIFSISFVRLGVASAERVLEIINTETELDENLGGYAQPMRGEITFEEVSFSYGDKQVLSDISFHLRPGQTVAIVGQTGSGKSALTQLVNRTYDASVGCILIDGIDVRRWNMNSLRAQISKIEQDVFLFSRSLAENIAFGAPDATQAEIEQAAKEAQAHDFIMSFKDGYQTIVGERGVTLSGGQRQRIALARAFLSNPRILILDDSTSAIDSATEDEIQKAIRRAQQGRTTLLITHRLSQIRWADHILVLDGGKVTASGTHEQLLRHSALYRRIFARYEVELPPLEVEQPQTA